MVRREILICESVLRYKRAAKQYAIAGRQSIPRHPPSGATEARERSRRFRAAAFFLGTLYMVQPSCGAIRPFWAGSFAVCGRRERAARAAGAKREGHLRFPSLFELLPFPQQPRERTLRPYFIGNSHIGTVSAHVFRAVAALSRQIARVLRKYCRRALTA